MKGFKQLYVCTNEQNPANTSSDDHECYTQVVNTLEEAKQTHFEYAHVHTLKNDTVTFVKTIKLK